jgi:hypothetical protein
MCLAYRYLSFNSPPLAHVSPCCLSHRPRRLRWPSFILPHRAAGPERQPRTPEGHAGAARRPELGPVPALPLHLFYGAVLSYKA